MSSGIETHEKGKSNIQIDGNTVAEDELSKNTVPNDHAQDFNVSPNTSSSVEESSINSHNVTDEDNPQVTSSREHMKEMLANRGDKKLTEKFQLIVANFFRMNQTLIFVREYLIAWRNKTILLTKP